MSKIAKISFSLTSLGMPGLTLSQISITKTFRYLKIRKETMKCMMRIFSRKKLYLKWVNWL